MASLGIRFSGEDKIQFDQISDEEIQQFLGWFGSAPADGIWEVPSQGEWSHYVQKRNITRVVVMP